MPAHRWATPFAALICVFIFTEKAHACDGLLEPVCDVIEDIPPVTDPVEPVVEAVLPSAPPAVPDAPVAPPSVPAVPVAPGIQPHAEAPPRVPTPVTVVPPEPPPERRLASLIEPAPPRSSVHQNVWGPLTDVARNLGNLMTFVAKQVVAPMAADPLTLARLVTLAVAALLWRRPEFVSTPRHLLRKNAASVVLSELRSGRAPESLASEFASELPGEREPEQSQRVA